MCGLDWDEKGSGAKDDNEDGKDVYESEKARREEKSLEKSEDNFSDLEIVDLESLENLVSSGVLPGLSVIVSDSVLAKIVGGSATFAIQVMLSLVTLMLLLQTFCLLRWFPRAECT